MTRVCFRRWASPRRVADFDLGRGARHERDPLGVGLDADQRLDAAQRLPEPETPVLQLHLVGLDAREVEDVGDDREQVLRGGLDLAELLDLAPVARALARQMGHAHDGVHGRAQLVAHRREEGALGPVRGLGGVLGCASSAVRVCTSSSRCSRCCSSSASAALRSVMSMQEPMNPANWPWASSRGTPLARIQRYAPSKRRNRYSVVKRLRLRRRARRSPGIAAGRRRARRRSSRCPAPARARGPELEPDLVEPGEAPVDAGHPDHHRRAVGHGAEAALALGQRLRPPRDPVFELGLLGLQLAEQELERVLQRGDDDGLVDQVEGAELEA